MECLVHLPGQPSRLYPRVLGDAWAALPRSIRRAHDTGRTLQGHFRIAWGPSFLAKMFARLSGLPRESRNEPVTLKIGELTGGEVWERTFGKIPMATQQYSSTDGLLIERFRGWDLTFLLQARGNALIYSPKRAHFALGFLRLRLPLMLAPRVTAIETGIDPVSLHVNVRVCLPFVGLLIEYDGRLNLPKSAP